jgi:hypothetical protein
VSQPFLHEDAERVRPVVSEWRSLAVPGRAVQSERIMLVDASLETHALHAFATRFVLETKEEAPSEPETSRVRRDVHALQLAIPVGIEPERAATERLAAPPRDEKTHVRSGQPLEIDEVVALGRIERALIAVELLDQPADVVLKRRFEGDRDLAHRAIEYRRANRDRSDVTWPF